MALLWIFWAAPATMIGLAVGALGLLTGGKVQRHGRVLEFCGGAIDWMLRRLTPIEGGAAAMTIGHVVIGRSAYELDRCREHELVHVRQYERWGPFFLPAYFACSFYLWLVGRDFYRENPFEREAYEHHDPRNSHP